MEEELRDRLWGDRDLFYEQDLIAFREVTSALYSERLNEALESSGARDRALVDRDRVRGRHAVHQRSYLDLKLRLADHLLTDHGDRMMMAHSVEGRYPFLDQELVDLVRRMPPHLKVNDMTDKYAVRRIAEGLVPRQILEREKFGFRAPGSPFLLQRRVEWVEDLLSPARIERQGYFDPGAVARLEARYSREGFRLNPHLEPDLLMVVLTFNLLSDLFELPDLS
jgi:asparagine synthase (glutamine-hydrolysing)